MNIGRVHTQYVIDSARLVSTPGVMAASLRLWRGIGGGDSTGDDWHRAARKMTLPISLIDT
jgi:hypothetical protein